MGALLAGLGLALGGAAGSDSMPPRRDPAFGPDKVKHAVFAFALQSGAYATARAGVGHRGALVGATAFTVALSLHKERRDRATTGFSVRDLAWDAAGILVATFVLARQPAR